MHGEEFPPELCKEVFLSWARFPNVFTSKKKMSHTTPNTVLLN